MDSLPDSREGMEEAVEGETEQERRIAEHDRVPGASAPFIAPSEYARNFARWFDTPPTADTDDTDGEDESGREAVPVDIDEYGAGRSQDWRKGWVDGLLWSHGAGPYSDRSWRSTHPDAPDPRAPRTGDGIAESVLADTLRLISAHGCSTYTGMDCRADRARLSKVGTSEQWCDECRAMDALQRAGLAQACGEPTLLDDYGSALERCARAAHHDGDHDPEPSVEATPPAPGDGLVAWLDEEIGDAKRDAWRSDAITARLKTLREVRARLDNRGGEGRPLVRAAVQPDAVDDTRADLVVRMRALIEWVSERDHGRAIELDHVTAGLDQVAAVSGACAWEGRARLAPRDGEAREVEARMADPGAPDWGGEMSDDGYALHYMAWDSDDGDLRLWVGPHGGEHDWAVALSGPGLEITLRCTPEQVTEWSKGVGLAVRIPQLDRESEEGAR